MFTSKQQGKTAKESPKFPQSQQPGEAMRNFYEVMTIDNQEMTIEAVEIPSGYRWKNLELTIEAPENVKQALAKVAKTYEADYLENQTQVKLILSIEREEEQEEWIETVMDEINQELDKQPDTLALGTTYKLEETDETLKTLQVVTAQDLHDVANFERKEELTQQEKEDDTLGQAIAQFLRINEPLVRDQKEVKVNQNLTNTAEKVRIHYPTITGNNQELVAIIERTYTKTTPEEVPINNKKTKTKQGAVGNYYITEDTLIEFATFEEVQRKTSADFEDILESMNLYTTPDFIEFWEMNWANFPTIQQQRTRTAQQFVELVEEEIRETLAYTSTSSTYNELIKITKTHIAHTYTEKMNPHTYVFLIIREYK